MSGLNAIELGPYLAAGTVLGAAYFALLYLTVRMHASQSGAFRILPLHCLRFALAGLGFWFVARQGATPLLSATLGFISARYVMLRSLGRV